MPEELTCVDCLRRGEDHRGPHQANGAAIINGQHVRWVTYWHANPERVRQVERAQRRLVAHA